MAGAILITEESVLSLSSIEFFYIIDTIRKFFNERDAEVVNEIYSPVDSAGMTYISLIDESTAYFNAFFNATLLAYASEVKNGVASFRQDTWKDLISSLKLDSRCNADVSLNENE